MILYIAGLNALSGIGCVRTYNTALGYAQEA